MKSALKFGQKTAFKMKSYSPAKQTVDPDAPGTPGKPGYEPPVVRGELDEKGKAIYDAHRNKATKEWLMENKGFNQEDADRMMADGAYSYKDMMKEKGAHKNPKAKKDVAAEPKGKGSEGKPKQEDFEPAYEGADYSKKDIAKMTAKEKAAKIDGYEAKPKKKKTPLEQEGPIPKKNIKLQKGEHPDTYLFGHNYGDENIEGAGEGFEPTGTRGEQFTANERINDMEERAGFLIDNDIPDLEGSTDPKDVKKLKTLKATAKKLQHEADIMRKRRENEKKSSPAKQAIDNIEYGGMNYKAYKYHKDYGTGENAVSKKEERKATRKWKKEHGVKGKTGGRHEKRLEKKAVRKLKKSEKSHAKYEEAKKAYYDDDVNNKKDWKKLQKTRKKADKRRGKATSAELKVRHNRELASVKGDKRNKVELSKAYSKQKLPEMQKMPQLKIEK